MFISTEFCIISLAMENWDWGKGNSRSVEQGVGDYSSLHSDSLPSLFAAVVVAAKYD